jgi:hypothetical protein
VTLSFGALVAWKKKDKIFAVSKPIGQLLDDTVQEHCLASSGITFDPQETVVQVDLLLV